MTPQVDSLNSCFSEVTGRGCSIEACFPRKDLDTGGWWCAPGQTCNGRRAAGTVAGEVLPHVETAPRLTEALLEAYDRIGKLTAPSASLVETPAVSEQLCKPAVLLQAEATAALATSAVQPYADHLATSQQQQPERATEGDWSDTASETGSSSTPPPRKGRRGINRGTPKKAAARSAQPPPTLLPRLQRVDFPWTRSTASRHVQSWLALEGPERHLDEEFFHPRKAARYGEDGSPGASLLPTCPELRAHLAADMAGDSHIAELAADMAPQPFVCPEQLPAVVCAADLALMSTEPLEIDSKAGSLPSGVPEWGVQVWPVPHNCNGFGTLP